MLSNELSGEISHLEKDLQMIATRAQFSALPLFLAVFNDSCLSPGAASQPQSALLSLLLLGHPKAPSACTPSIPTQLQHPSLTAGRPPICRIN